MAKKKAAKKKAARKHPANPSTSTKPQVVKSKKANTDMGALVAPPPEQQKFAGKPGRSAKEMTIAKTNQKAIMGHVSASGRKAQTARDVRNAPRKRG